MNEVATRHEFQAEVKQLLDLMVHSLYSNKEVFLRELISNASDALDRRRFEGLTNDAVRTDEELQIRLDVDRGARTLTIEDNGIGMSRQEVVENLGTIARSGTKEFVRKAKNQEGGLPPELIGQFGVGFYSSFMVAEEVSVLTRRAGEDRATSWRSTADGGYEITEAERAQPGTSITLKLKPVSEEDGIEDYTDEYALRRIVKRYSDFVSYPIRMKVTRTERESDGSTNIVTKDEQLNSQRAIWSRPKSEITDEEHEQFYRHIAHDWSKPIAHVDVRIEGTFEAQGLLYIPSEAPFDLYHPEMKRGIQLYVRRVFIMDECKDLAPSWLRFVKGVIDAQDLDLNVSREMLQQSRQIRAIRKQVVKKVLDELHRLKAEARESYEKVWANFGPVLKEGLIQAEDKDRDRLMGLLLSPSTKEASTSLEEYVQRMPPGQKDIFYLVGPSLAAAKRSPHLEAFEEKGYEVLILTDNIDELWLERQPTFGDRKLVSIGHGEVDLEAAEDEGKKREKQEAREAKEKELSGLLKKLRSLLQDDVKEVRVSSRLTTSPVCLVGEEGDMSPQLEKLMQQLGREVPRVKRILEINPGHPVIARLQAVHEERPDDPKLKDYADLLYGQAILAEGGHLSDPARFGALVAALMAERM